MPQLLAWFNENAGSIQAIATAVQVVVTIVLVIVTGYYARETKRIANQTEALADATDSSQQVPRRWVTRPTPTLKRPRELLWKLNASQ
jgi:hypothetical protein